MMDDQELQFASHFVKDLLSVIGRPVIYDHDFGEFTLASQRD